MSTKGFSIKQDKDLWFRIALNGRIIPAWSHWKSLGESLYRNYNEAYNALRRLRRANGKP